MSWKQDIITEVTELKEVLKTKLNELLTKVESKAVKLTADQPNAKINLLDINNNVISTLDVGFLNNEGTTIFFNTTTEEIELKDDAGNVLSSFPASALMTGVPFGIDLTGSTLALVDSANAVVDSVTLKIANIQGLQAALDAKATPSDIKDGTFTVSGTGSLTGSGSMTANQSGNTTAQLDLTATAKQDIIDAGKQDLQSVTDNGNETTNDLATNYNHYIGNSIRVTNTSAGNGVLIETNIPINTVSYASFVGVEFSVLPSVNSKNILKVKAGCDLYGNGIQDFYAEINDESFFDNNLKAFFKNGKLFFWFEIQALGQASTAHRHVVIDSIKSDISNNVIANLTEEVLPTSGVTGLIDAVFSFQATQKWVTDQLSMLPAGYTDEEAQDAVGTILSANLAYNDATPEIDLSSAILTKIDHGETAFGWGNHASAGYLKTETDTLQSVTDRGASSTNAITVKALKVTDTPLLNGITNDKVLTTDANGNLTMVDGAEPYVTIPDWSGDLLAGLNF